jgi:hypothetical protein
VEPWSGVREATTFGAEVPQLHPDDPQWAALLPDPAVPGEDCLNLNIWTPDLGSAGLPVMVWIPGGMFEFGTGASYNGSRFARDGIVCVSINYRVGAGLSYLGDGTANLGLLDQIAALQWVREVQTDWWCRIPAIRLPLTLTSVAALRLYMYEFVWPSRGVRRTPGALPRPRSGLRIRRPEQRIRAAAGARPQQLADAIRRLGVLRDHRRLAGGRSTTSVGHHVLQHHRARRGRSASGGTGTVAGPTLACQGLVVTALIL